MLDYPLLAALAAVIRTGSFERAARQLHVTPSAVSQRVKLLEERLGTVLVVRGQPCTGTAAGQRLCQHVEQVALLESELRGALPGLSPADGPVTLRIAVNADSLATWFVAAMAEVPGCLFDLVLDDQDHSAEWLRKGEVLAAVTASAAPVPGCNSHPLGALRYRATASPDYLRRHFPDGVTAESLATAPCLTFNRKDRLQAQWLRLVLGDRDPGPVPTPPTHWLPSTHAFVDGALAGLGWGMNPDPLVADHLAAGRLVELVPGRPLDVPLHWQQSRIAGTALAELSRAVLRSGRQALHPIVESMGSPPAAGGLCPRRVRAYMDSTNLWRDSMTSSAAMAANDTPDLGALPTWDLSDLYPGTESPELKADLDRMERECKAFRERYAGKLAALSGDDLAAAIRQYEDIDETLSRVMSYAGLVYNGNMVDPTVAKFYQSAQERVNDISAHLIFFTLEINRLDENDLAAKQKASSSLRHYEPWLRDVRLYRDHQLSDEIERLLHEKHVVGRAAWNRLFDETIASLRFPMGGKELTCAEALNRLSDRNPAVRREAGEVVGKVLGENARLFALVTNTLAKDKEIEDEWRNYPTPTSARNLSNRVEDEVVDALVSAVKGAYPDLSHRYYTMKAKWFGQDHLDYWDRNAPLPEDADRSIPWNEARDIVLGAYDRFSPDLASLGKRFFDNPWIDAPVRPGKAPGAFAHPTVPSVHPYLLVNYQGKTRDVMTLAHELGHGVHQILAGKQGHFLSDTPLTLAETASVFGEMLTFRALLAAETDPKRRRIMLAGKVEDMLNTVVRQVAFFDFERRVHTERREGELTSDRIGEIWMAVQTESLGPALRFDEGYRHFWSYIPHFIHSPFYVYAYAFGDCLVNSLYAVYQDAEQGFAEKYLAMLSAGGTLRHKELLAPFGLDASDPAFWQKGLGVIRGFIDELEASEAKAGPSGWLDQRQETMTVVRVWWPSERRLRRPSFLEANIMLATTTPASTATPAAASTVPMLGYAVMDRDHVDSVALLQAACEAPTGELRAPFSAFAKHLREHFARENALMTQHGFFALHCHTEEHARVLTVVATMEADLAEGKENRARLYVTEHFPDWFHTHLATMDRVTADFLAQAEGGGTGRGITGAASPTPN